MIALRPILGFALLGCALATAPSHAQSSVAQSETIPTVFHGCKPEGSDHLESRQQLNVLKNRSHAPTPGDFDSDVTLARVLEPAKGSEHGDENRWSQDSAAILTGYVLRVMYGGPEPANCDEPAEIYWDTHIEIIADPTDTAQRKRVIVEVTPRWRALMARQGVDWSTDHLKALLEGHCARFEGWLFWDRDHWKEAENTAPGQAGNWRATAWEIHPVTGIASVSCSSS